ncbi:hypothetical protein [Parasedimentitalea psychrophila]|uniref:Peptidase M48 domain-containing protein n=1 Tax=Parasedimentitalea psychrophila TaxID=2997337 RepID=A0A9Y2P6T3_9RHOB|nr:hypothetical protein [Parasedimentitalea psychrophila]WIY25338.1 hypothetical protein QPJ95_23155 [Parasedimentitalea psychrophila]
MTALREYQRLEAAGLWRASPEEQRRDVIVSVGDATLTIIDMKERPLAHWSLAAVERQNPGRYPALFHPDGDPGETLELGEDETTMLKAIERVQQAIAGARPHPGRLRSVSVLGGLGLFAALLVFWLPGAMIRHTVSVVPDIKRKAIGQALLGRIERVSGQACSTPETAPILAKLAERTGVRQVVVLRDGLTSSLHLPGNIVLLNRSLIEDHEDPAVAAGAILIERARAQTSDPLIEVLTSGGMLASFRLLTTGKLDRNSLDRFTETMVSAPRPDVPQEKILATFAQAAIPSTPYAYAQDITGEKVLGLIEADPMAGRSLEPVLNDRDWVQLQNICG